MTDPEWEALQALRTAVNDALAHSKARSIIAVLAIPAIRNEITFHVAESLYRAGWTRPAEGGDDRG